MWHSCWVNSCLGLSHVTYSSLTAFRGRISGKMTDRPHQDLVVLASRTFLEYERILRSTLHNIYRSLMFKRRVSFAVYHMHFCGFVVQRSMFLATDPGVRVRFPALQDFLKSNGSGTWPTQIHEYRWGATWKKKLLLPSRKPSLRPERIPALTMRHPPFRNSWH
jgi:hypothetical protein